MLLSKECTDELGLTPKGKPTAPASVPVFRTIPAAVAQPSRKIPLLGVVMVTLLFGGASAVVGTIIYDKITKTGIDSSAPSEPVAVVSAPVAPITPAVAKEAAVKEDKPAAATVQQIAPIVSDDPKAATPKPPKVTTDSGTNRTPKVDPAEEAKRDARLKEMAKEADAIAEKAIRDKFIAERKARNDAALKEEDDGLNKKGELVWIAGAKAMASKEMLDDLKDFRHVELDKQKVPEDKYGARVFFVGNDGLEYFIRAPFKDDTAKKIKSKFGLVEAKDKFPQVDLPLNYRNRNLPDGGGCCLWASISTQAYVHGYTFRLEDNRRGGAMPSDGVRVLKRAGIPAQWTPMTRNANLQYLRDACDAGIGCTVGVCLGYGPEGPMLHEINLAGLSDKEAATLDNNDRKLKVRFVPIERFKKLWDGSSIVIFPKGKENALAKYGKPDGSGRVNPHALVRQDKKGPRDLSGDERGPARPGPAGPDRRGPDAEEDEIGAFDTGFYSATNAREYFKAAGYTEKEIEEKMTQGWLYKG